MIVNTDEIGVIGRIMAGLQKKEKAGRRNGLSALLHEFSIRFG